jgi:hypothetical protein
MTEAFDLTPPEAPSPRPYIPGTKIQFAWDSTSLGDFKKCPRYYQLTELEGWQSKKQSVHLRFGLEVNDALHDYAKGRATGLDHEDALHDAMQELILRCADYPEFDPDDRPSERAKAKDNLYRVVVDYLDHYNPDPAETVILENGKVATEVSFRFELDYGPNPDQPYLLCGHLDKIVRFAGDLYVMDHKTTYSTPGPFYFQQYEPNNQMTLYTLASQIVMHSPIRGVIIDVIQSPIADPPKFVRGFTYRTPDQIEEWLIDLRKHLEAAERCAEEGYWPMNDTACDKFGGCRFRDVCAKSPQVRDRFLSSNFEQRERWNPLKVR